MYTVLAIVAHPDDMEEVCAGTLLKCKERGDRVVVCHISSGSLGHEVIQPDELRVIRAKEAKKSCDMAGFELIHAGFDDLEIYDGNKEARDKMVNVIRDVNPDFILTHAPNDYMPDHTACSKLVFDASFAATVPNYRTRSEQNAKLVPIYYIDTYAGVDFVPTEYVDISDQIEKKIAMAKCHESQLTWLEEHDNIDFAETVRVCARYRGLQCGVMYAEGFRQCNTSLKQTVKRYLP